jgi:hypothetical protein
MNQREHLLRQSFLNWLGLGLLGLLVFGLLHLSHNNQPEAEPQEAAEPAAITQDLSSPMPAALLSPISPAQESPLSGASTATIPPLGLSSPLPSPTAALESATGAPYPTPTRLSGPGFHLTVLHTNDTWGYLNPCG